MKAGKRGSDRLERITATVSQLNNFIKRTFEANPVFSDIWIKGEISNFKKHYSGHIYLTLKDEGGVLKAVMFRSYTGSLKFSPSDGMKVMAHGRVSVYEQGGVYQLYIDEILPDGVGELYAAYERLKKKLGDEGIFDPAHKKPIPRYPEAIGIVTASTGAAVRDIINVCTRRFPYAKLILYPAQVQGIGAAKTVAEGIEYFNKKKLCDTIIVGRGGGSIEDLWAFNEEITAYAIYDSDIPVISAVGHEVDYTIADFAADLRAPTPSAAAEMAVPSGQELAGIINSMRNSLISGVMGNIASNRLRLKALKLISPKDMIENNLLRIDSVMKEIISSFEAVIHKKREQAAKNIAKLDAMSPLKVMARGFSIAKDDEGNIIKTASELDRAGEFILNMSKGKRRCKVIEKGK